jgi:hypothetical protein
VVPGYLTDHYYYTITLDENDFKLLHFKSHIRKHHSYHHLGGLSWIDLASHEHVDFHVNMEEVTKEYAENALKGRNQIFGPGAGVGLGIETFVMFVYYFFYKEIDFTFAKLQEPEKK